DTRGWTMSADGHRLIAHPWSRLFAASCLTRRQAPFNLVDYYKRVAGVAAGPQRLFFEVPADARRWAADFLAAAGVPPGAPLVAFQLGASRPVRRWPAAHFVAVARTLHAAIGARFLLCGGGGDRPVASEIATALGPLAIDACGRSSVAGLGALLEHADVLVTGDTGPMHMAVAVGTPVVALFFGPALPFDTGPYAADHVCLHAEVACAPCDHNVTCLEPFCRDTLALAADARDLDALEAAARRLEELDARLFRLGAMHEAAALLVQVFRFEKENLEGQDVGALARATRLVHEELAARARLLAEMLEPAGAVRPALPQGGNHASVR